MHAKRTRDRKKKLLEDSENIITRMEWESHLLRGYCVSVNMLSAEDATKLEERASESKRELAALKVLISRNYFHPNIWNCRVVQRDYNTLFSHSCTRRPKESMMSTAMRTTTMTTTITKITVTATTNMTTTAVFPEVMTTRSPVLGTGLTTAMTPSMVTRQAMPEALIAAAVVVVVIAATTIIVAAT